MLRGGTMNKGKIKLVAVGLGLVALVMLLSSPITSIGSGAQQAKEYTIDLQDNGTNMHSGIGANRDFNTQYWNNNSYPIVVYVSYYADFRTTTDWINVDVRVNNTLVSRTYLGDSVNVGLNYYDSLSFFVPAHASYRIDATGNANEGIDSWYEWNMLIVQIEN